MSAVDAYAKIKSLNQPIFQTRNIATFLQITVSAASKILGRLCQQGHLVHLSRGLWCVPERIDPLMLPEYLTAPFPSYISLQSALYHHGMISQIPEVVYAVSPARTKKHRTPISTISIHHIQPDFFFGYEIIGEKNIKLAAPEKALIDVCYLSTAKTKLFHSLPELEFPKEFDYKKAEQIIQRIKSKNRRTLVDKCFNALIFP